MTDTHTRAHVWTLGLSALVRAALIGPLVDLLIPLAHASAPALTVMAAVLALSGVSRMTTLPRVDAVVRFVPP